MRTPDPSNASCVGVRAVGERDPWSENEHGNYNPSPSASNKKTPLAGVFLLPSNGIGLEPQHSCLGSTTSRFWKCNAPKSLRLPRRHEVSRVSLRLRKKRSFDRFIFLSYFLWHNQKNLIFQICATYIFTIISF